MATERQKDKAVFPACIICSSCLQTDRFSFHFRHLRTTVEFAHSHVSQNLLFCLAVASPVNPGVEPTAPIDGTVICRSDTSTKSAGLSSPPPLPLPIRMLLLRPLIWIWSTTDGSKRMKSISRVGRTSTQLCSIHGSPSVWPHTLNIKLTLCPKYKKSCCLQE